MNYRFSKRCILQYGYPLLGRIRCNADIPGQIRVGKNLSGPNCSSSQEAIKISQICHVQDVAHISFQIGTEIGPIPEMGIDFRFGISFFHFAVRMSFMNTGTLDPPSSIWQAAQPTALPSVLIRRRTHQYPTPLRSRSMPTSPRRIQLGRLRQGRPMLLHPGGGGEKAKPLCMMPVKQSDWTIVLEHTAIRPGGQE